MSNASDGPIRPAPPIAYRWLVVVCCSAAMFGCYYTFDALYPVAPLLEKTFEFTGEDIGLLDTVYNVAALLTLIAGGILIDRIGVAASALLFSTIGAAGSILIAVLPGWFPDHPWGGMLIGRFFLGVGSELFIVAATTVVGRWFKGKEVSFALAIQLLIARFGSYVADQSPNLFKDLFVSWQPPLMLAAAVGVSWIVFAGLYALLERVAGQRYHVPRAGATDKLDASDLFRFNIGYWWIVGLCVAFYATIFPFRTFANLYFIQGHGLSDEAAGALKSLLPMFSMIGMPIFGLLADKIGRRATLMVGGSLLLVPPFIFMTSTDLPLSLSMAMMGIAFALVPAVLWPAVTYLVPEARLGSAYALMTFCQQVFWALMSWGLGKVKDHAGASPQNPAGWDPVIWMLAGLATVGLVFALALWRYERGPNAHGLERAKVA
jgi:MFS family permease